MSPKTRAYLYRILTFALAVLVGYDIIADTAVPIWAAAGASALGLSVAAKHTPRQPES